MSITAKPEQSSHQSAMRQMVKIDTASLDDGRSLSRFMKGKESVQIDDQKSTEMNVAANSTTKSLAAVSATNN